MNRGTSMVLLALVTAGCSIPVADRATTYDPRDLPPELVEETTTTTTTATTAPATASVLDPSSQPSTTVPSPDTRPIKIFYHHGLSDEMQPLQIDRVTPVPYTVLKDLLESPTGITSFGLRSSVRFGLIDQVTIERGVATIALAPDVFDRMSSIEQRRAIAQIVLTFTSFETSDAGAIGQTQFTVDGQGISVFVPTLGGSSEPGQPLAFEDFAELIAATEPPPTTSTTTSAPATTAPASTSPATTTGQ